MVPFIERTDDLTGISMHRDLFDVWHHRYLGSALDSGAMHEIFRPAISPADFEGQSDFRNAALAFHDLVDGIPLNSGYHGDMNTDISDSNLKVVGQMDTTFGNAHPWIQNGNHTCMNAVGRTVAPVSHAIRIGECAPESYLSLGCWDTNDGSVQVDTLELGSDDMLTLPVNAL